MANEKTNREIAVDRWGGAAPEWVLVLADMCDAKSQAVVARSLGVSATMINQALRNSYAGRLDKLEQRVRGTFMNESLNCPVLGEITKRRCIDEQTRPFAPSNCLRIELRHACPRCPNSIELSNERGGRT